MLVHQRVYWFDLSLVHQPKKSSLPGQVRSARQQQRSSSTPRSGLDLGRNKQLGKMRKTSVAELWLDDLYLYVYINIYMYIYITLHYNLHYITLHYIALHHFTLHILQALLSKTIGYQVFPQSGFDGGRSSKIEEFCARSLIDRRTSPIRRSDFAGKRLKSFEVNIVQKPCWLMDWFKGKLEPENPMIFMGKYLWFLVEIFP